MSESFCGLSWLSDTDWCRTKSLSGTKTPTDRARVISVVALKSFILRRREVLIRLIGSRIHVCYGHVFSHVFDAQQTRTVQRPAIAGFGARANRMNGCCVNVNLWVPSLSGFHFLRHRNRQRRRQGGVLETQAGPAMLNLKLRWD